MSIPEISLAALLLAVNVLLVGAVLAPGVSAFLRLGRSAHPRIRFVMAVSALFLSILLPIWMTFGFSEKEETHTLFDAETSGRGSHAQSSEQSPAQVESPNMVVTETASVPAPNSGGYLPEVVITARLSLGLLALWAAVSFLLMARELSGYARLVRRRRSWRLADAATLERTGIVPVPLYLSETDGPFAAGILRQMIVFPSRLVADLPAESIRSIVLHELNHTRWRDPAVNALLRWTRAVFWFSPAIWYFERAARLEREVAADLAAVLSSRDETGLKRAAGDYAKTLIEVARWSAASIAKPSSGFSTTEVGGRTGLENRVRRLFGISENFARLRLSCAAAVLLAGIFGAWVLAVASHPLPISLDAQAAGAGIESARLEKTEASRFNDYYFGSQKSGGKTPSAIPPRQSQTQTESEPSKSPDAQGLLTAKIKMQTTALDEPFQPEEKSRAASIGNEIDETSLTAEQRESMRKHGVTAGYAEELAAVGYGNLPVDTLIEMKKFALSAAFVREMAGFGYGGLSSEELINFRRFGVSAGYIHEMKAAGYDNLQARLIIDFRREAVSTSYIREMRAAVAGGISSRQMLDLKKSGVSSGWIREINALGFENLTANQLVAMRLQGVNVSFIQKMRERGYQKASIDVLISLRAKGAG